MAKLMSEQDFKKEIAKADFTRIYLIYGEEKYLVKHYTNSLVNKVTNKKANSFDFLKFGANADLQELCTACEQIPMSAQYKCILVSDFDFEALSESDFKEFNNFCMDISPSTVLIFSMPTLIIDAKKNGKFKRFSTTAEKVGITVEFAKKDNSSLEKQLVSWAEKAGCTLTLYNASKIVAMCGTDMTLLRNELQKLTAYANGSEITEDIIKLLAVKNTETRIFALSDCIMAGNFQGAYSQLAQLFEQNEKPEIILSTLGSVYIDMYRMRVANESGKTIADVSTDFKYGRRDFVLKKANANSKRYSTTALRKVLDIILQTDIKLKSTRNDSKILLETLITKIMLALREDI